MTIFIVTIIATFTVIISKYYFNKWFNHLFLYTVSWSLFLILYELKLVSYIELSSEALFVFFIAFFGILSGVLTIIMARRTTCSTKPISQKIRINSYLFENNFKTIKILITITSILGMLSAYANWSNLLDKFGSFTAILFRANAIYRMRIAGEFEAGIPYLSIFPYVGVILSGIYTAAKGKISLLSILPFLVVIISDFALVGRGGIFVAFIMLVTSVLLFRNIVPRVENLKFILKKSGLVKGGFVIVIAVLISFTLVSESRGRFEAFKGTSRVFKYFKDIPLIGAQEYFYFSSNVGVFTKYFEIQKENPKLGENTLLPIHNLLANIGFGERAGFYPRGYHIPDWSNSATYLRDLHADFGPLGMILIPYLLSLFATFSWFKFMEEGNLIAYINLIYLNVILGLSVFNMQTRAAFFLVSYVILILLFTILEKWGKK